MRKSGAKAHQHILFICIFLLFGCLAPTKTYPQAIVADHKAVQHFQRIPYHWLLKAREWTIHYAHTSHGAQVWQGLENLETQNPKYGFARRESGTEGLPPVENPPVLRMYDGNPPDTYIGPEDYWSTLEGRDRTRAVANTGKYHFSMWAWCGQVSEAQPADIQSYLDTLHQFEIQYPSMRFIYMTGHLDGTGSAGNLHQRNQQIRDYCAANNKVLFDFADIERYNPDGMDFLDLGATDECDYNDWTANWADEWCAAHPGSPLCDPCEHGCEHSRSLNCNMKARAFWWMMARLAGWNGQPASPPLPLLLLD